MVQRVGPPISPRVSDAREFERDLRSQVLRPMVATAQQAILRAGEHYEAIREEIRRLPEHPDVVGARTEAAAAAHYQRLKEWHTKRFTRSMSRLLGVRGVGPLDEDAIRPAMEKAIREAVRLVKTIPPRYHSQLMADMLKLGADAPFDRRALQEVLSRGYRSAGHNLKRLVRDQTSKTVGALTGVRQKQVGIERYIWSTSADERVRPSHREQDGVTFAWDSPPFTGHPGEDINCRCVALAVIPDRRSHIEPTPRPPAAAPARILPPAEQIETR